MPLNPTVANSATEPPPRSIIAMSINGVPAYGPQEGGNTNAVEPPGGSQITDAQYWYGHAGMFLVNRRFSYQSFFILSLGFENTSMITLILICELSFLFVFSTHSLARNNDWHVHNPYLGQENPSEDDLLGYALDGFKIYGPLADASVLDDCNGRTVSGEYRYHVRVRFESSTLFRWLICHQKLNIIFLCLLLLKIGNQPS